MYPYGGFYNNFMTQLYFGSALLNSIYNAFAPRASVSNNSIYTSVYPGSSGSYIGNSGQNCFDTRVGNLITSMPINDSTGYYRGYYGGEPQKMVRMPSFAETNPDNIFTQSPQRPSTGELMNYINLMLAAPQAAWRGDPAKNPRYGSDLTTLPTITENGYGPSMREMAYLNWLAKQGRLPAQTDPNKGTSSHKTTGTSNPNKTTTGNTGKTGNTGNSAEVTANNAKGVNMDVTVLYTGTAEDLNAHLGGVLENMGSVFMKAQEKYGINAAFLASICKLESANGTSDIAKNKNNVGGVRIPGKYEFQSYDSVEDCIMHIARFLKSGYIDKGKTTISQIGLKYCPPSDPTDKKKENSQWANRVSNIYNNNFV